jgi:hypothetical protein
MAYTSRNFLRDLAIYSTGAAVGIKNTAKFTSYAAKKGIQLAGIGAARASPSLGSAALTAGRTSAALAAANPVSTGLGLGLGFTQTPMGQALLEEAAVRGAADRRALEQAIDERIFSAVGSVPGQQDFRESIAATVTKKAKRKASKYNRAMSAAMKAVKKSNKLGKRGTISNPKRAFKTVSRVVSAVNKGKKVSAKGVTGTIARAARRILK